MQHPRSGVATYQAARACPSSTAPGRHATGVTTRTPRCPGIFGPSHLPHLLRNDYVTNSNDSYWLSNPHHPLTGFARIIGDENDRALAAHPGRPDHDPGPGLGHGREEGLHAARDAGRWSSPTASTPATCGATSWCRSAGLSSRSASIPSTGAVTSIGNACDVLAKWDLHENADSKGAILFRRFVDNLQGSPAGVGGTLGLVGLTGPYWQHAVRRQRPGPHAVRAEHRGPAGRGRAGRRDQ